MTVTERLFTLQDTKYRDFSARLTPNISKDAVIGVRAPAIRALAKELYGTDEAVRFMAELPHKYFDENNLHGALICRIRDYASAMAETERFLPYIDNWAVCDTFSPKCFEKNVDKLWGHIEKWLCSNKTYTVRFGIVCAMRYFLDEDFSTNKFEKVISLSSNEYYVNMAIAWYVSVALVKQYDEVLPYIENNTLPKWVRNKSIQKACESFRISNDKKEYLKTLKMHE